MTDLTLHEAITTTRAMRRLKPDPVPQEHLRYIVEAATHAPSGGNIQNWAFVIVTDPDVRRTLGDLYRDVGEEYLRRFFEADGAADATMPDEQRKMYDSSRYLVEHFSEAPALIAVCMRGKFPGSPETASAYYGSVYPAVQNLILAARSRGLGTTVTTLHAYRQQEVKELLEMPENVNVIAVIPVGYPQGKWGRPKRAPAESVTHWDRWGGPRPGD